jgi:hypothetical protein
MGGRCSRAALSPSETCSDTAVPGAEVKRQFPPEGFACTIELPLPQAT